jgi:hypothetical protein
VLVEILPDLDGAGKLPLHRTCGGVRSPLLGEPEGDSHRALHFARELSKFTARRADPGDEFRSDRLSHAVLYHIWSRAAIRMPAGGPESV